MKKLMFAAVAAVMTAGVAQAAYVYDFKASVKHLYLRPVSVKVGKLSYTVYQKFQKAANLKGYLIVDNDGVTSKTVTGGVCDPATTGDVSLDYMHNRSFLVVQNANADKALRFPKIMPAVLDAKWLDTAFTKTDYVIHTAKSGLAEGTLFVGGDSIKCVRTQLYMGVPTDYAAAPQLPAANVPGMTAYADYLWTSVYLFGGQYNGPNWFSKPIVPDDYTKCLSPFDKFEGDWDANLPAGVQTDWANRCHEQPDVQISYFHDTWMNGAGFGKWTKDFTKTPSAECCGIIRKAKTTGDDPILESLSGNLKGGIFLCTENGIDVYDPDYAWFDGLAWEDQFYTKRLDAAVTFAPDAWQNDLWQDGAVEQETTDVVFGTWSIKLNTKFFATKGGIAREFELVDYWPGTTIRFAAGTVPLWSAINGAALKLNPKTNVIDGSEIYSKTASTRFDIPMVTPKFAKYYGLAVDL